MANPKYLTPEARQYIMEQMYEIGEINTEEVMEMISPHFLFDPVLARDQQVRRLAHRLMAAMRDEKGVRNCFALKDNNTYINVDKSVDHEALAKVEKALKSNVDGLEASWAKVKKRREEIEGQLSMNSAAEN